MEYRASARARASVRPPCNPNLVLDLGLGLVLFRRFLMAKLLFSLRREGESQLLVGVGVKKELTHEQAHKGQQRKGERGTETETQSTARPSSSCAVKRVLLRPPRCLAVSLHRGPTEEKVVHTVPRAELGLVRGSKQLKLCLAVAEAAPSAYERWFVVGLSPVVFLRSS